MKKNLTQKEMNQLNYAIRKHIPCRICLKLEVHQEKYIKHFAKHLEWIHEVYWRGLPVAEIEIDVVIASAESNDGGNYKFL